MTGSAEYKDKCTFCEIPMKKIEAEGRTWTEIISYRPSDHAGIATILYFAWYCDTCWEQQQARMFG